MKATVLIAIVAISVVSLAAAGAPAEGTDQLLGQYYSIQKSLASDSVNGVAASATEIAKISRQAASTQPQTKVQLTAIADAAVKLNAADLKSARNGFEALSDKLIAYVKASGAKTNPPYQFYCPMLKKNWLQPDKTASNPYYGSEMPKCGDLVQWEKSAEKPAEQPMDMGMGHHH